MQFNTINFRTLDPDKYPLDIEQMKQSPTILIKASGEITPNFPEGYDEAAGDILLFAWMGQWKTDVFVLTEADLQKHYYAPKALRAKEAEERRQKRQDERDRAKLMKAKKKKRK